MTILSVNIVLDDKVYKSHLIFEKESSLISLIVLEDRELDPDEMVGLSAKVPVILQSILRVLPLAALKTCLDDDVKLVVRSLHTPLRRLAEGDLDYQSWWEALPTSAEIVSDEDLDIALDEYVNITDEELCAMR